MVQPFAMLRKGHVNFFTNAKERAEAFEKQFVIFFLKKALSYVILRVAFL
jgi:hypothetical protein